MNNSNTNDYYLISRNMIDNSFKKIPLNIKWFKDNSKDEYSYKNNISAIDIVTTKFNNIDELIKRMFEKGYIDTLEVDLYIVHKNKYNGHINVKEYELLFNRNNNRMDSFKRLANIKNNNLGINEDNKDIDDLLNKYVSKIKNVKSFYNFMTFEYSMLDSYVSEKTIQLRNVDSLSLKYYIKGKFSNYLVIRNLIYMWNFYDSIVNETKKENPNITDEELSKIVIRKYMDNQAVIIKRKINNPKLIKKIDKNYIEGQNNMFEESKEDVMEIKVKPDSDLFNINSKTEIMSEKEKYLEKINEMIKEEEKIKNEEFDDPKLKKLYEQFDKNSVVFKNYIEINKATLEDQFRLGLFVDYVEYKRRKREEDRKREEEKTKGIRYK